MRARIVVAVKLVVPVEGNIPVFPVGQGLQGLLQIVMYNLVGLLEPRPSAHGGAFMRKGAGNAPISRLTGLKFPVDQIQMEFRVQ